MTIEEILIDDPKVRRRFMRLDTEARNVIVEGYRRHLRACRAANMPTDRLWLTEVITDAMRGVYAFEGERV